MTMKQKLIEVKNKTKTYAPAVIGGLAIGAAAAVYLTERKYNPTDKVAIQLPKGALDAMRIDGKGLAIHNDEGWFTLKYHPQDEK